MVVKIQQRVSELFILWYSLFMGSFFRAATEPEKTPKNVLVILPLLGIGDFVCSADFIKRLRNIYQLEKGYKIYLTLDTHLLNFAKVLLNGCEIRYIPLEMDNDDERGFKRYKRIVNLWRQYNWHTVVATHRLGMYFKLALFTLNFHHAYLIDYVNETPSFTMNTVFNDYLESKRCVRIARVSSMDMIISNMNKLMRLISGREDVFAGISSVKEFEGVGFPHYPYCIISCGLGKGHPYAHRSWAPERYAAVANHIIKNFHLKVYLVGAKEDIPNNDKIYDAVMDSGQVINVTGKTNFKEWVELMRHAKFILGNDSGYIHLAAAVNTQAFCIGGFWNYGRYLPYPFHGTRSNLKAPVFIHATEPPCKWCSMKKLWKDKATAQIAESLCEENIRLVGRYRCIEDVSTELVIKTLNEWYLHL